MWRAAHWLVCSLLTISTLQDSTLAMPNGALSFDGLDDWVTLPITPDLQLVQTDFTIEAWVQSNSPTADSRLISGCTPGYYCYQIAITGGRVVCDLTSGPGWQNINFSSSRTLPANEWHHVAMVRRGTTVELFIDGVFDSSGTNAGVTYEGTINEIRIGRRQGGCCPFAGRVDEMRVWGYARSSTAIQSDMSRSLSGNEPGLRAYWTFDEAAGQVVGDHTGRGNSGTRGSSSGSDADDPSWVASDAPVLDQSGCASQASGLVAWWKGQGNALDSKGSHHATLQSGATFESGQVGQAFSLNGQGAHVQLEDRDLLDGMAELTIELWAKFRSFGADTDGTAKPLVSKWFTGGDPARNSYRLVQRGTQLSFSAQGSNGWATVDLPHSLALNAWAHIAVVFNRGVVELFINGVSLGTQTLNIDAIASSSEPLRVGDWYHSYDGAYATFDGALDEVSIYRRALTAPETLAVYEADTAGKCQTSACDVPVPSPAPRWRQLNPPVSPPGRMHQALAYDSTRNVIVMAGGAISCADRRSRADFTWEFDGTNWREVITQASPPGRYHPGIAFDAQRNRTVIYGGMSPSGAIGDTWEYDGTNWYPATAPHSPGICHRAAMAFDPLRRVIVMRTGDGLADPCANPNSTWEYDGADWVRVQTQGASPTPSGEPTMIWDPAIARIVLFTGNRAWTYDGVAWQLRDDFECGDRPLALDTLRQRYVGGSGEPSSAPSFSLTWEWDGQVTSQSNVVPLAPPPRALSQNEMSFMESTGEIVLFGGFDYCNSNTYSDTWVYSVDSDLDGFSDLRDCAPQDAGTYPGAPQQCDSVNNDCRSIDWPAVPAAEADLDSDGVRACDGDCNDGNPDIRPGVQEVCDGLDNDCDTLIDEDALGADTDADGIANLCDNCRDRFNADQRDNDLDGVGNACDNCLQVPNPSQLDIDADALGDACDNCRLSYNPSQADFDSDFVGDVCDNCISTKNESQHDFDADAEGDECDLNDGIIIFRRIDKPRVRWQTDPSFTSYNLYRGALAVLLAGGPYSQTPGSSAYAGRFCGVGVAFQDDMTTPLPGEALYWLVSGVRTSGEAPLGSGDTVSRANENPCP